MNAKLLFAISVIAIFFCAPISAQTTEFTYQGSLTSSGSPANGSHDLEFALFDSAGGAGQVGPTLTRNGVNVSNGIFSVSLDFGAVFTGAARFLEIRVRPTGGGAFTPLSPRQPIASTPYAIKSLTADSATTATNATQLGGVPASSYLQAVSRNPTLSGSGTTASPLAVAIPLSLAGGDPFGVIFGNNSAAGSGVVGFSSSGTGVRGQGGTANPGTGVFGVGFYGVEGATFASGPTRAIGVYGRAGSTTGDTSGVEGENASSSGTGVFGLATSTTGSTVGVRGQANSPDGIGVRGVGAGATGPSTGVFGSSNSPDGRGVVGQNSNGGFGGFFVGKSYFADRVGLGTLTPAASLDVFATNNNQTLIGGGLATGSEVKLTSSGTAHFSLYNSGNGNLTFANTSATTATNTVGTPLVSITSVGNVGIGTASPGTRLQVAGQTRTNTLFIENFVGGVGSIGLCTTGSGGNANLVGTCSSSVRYKTNVQPFDGGLRIISRLRPISFDWKDNGGRDVGLAAEEVASVAPLLAFRNDKGEIEGVKYNQLSAVLINAIKEQQEQIEIQKGENERLNKKLESLQREIDELRAFVCAGNGEAAVCRKKP